MAIIESPNYAVHAAEKPHILLGEREEASRAESIIEASRGGEVGRRGERGVEEEWQDEEEQQAATQVEETLMVEPKR